MNAFYRDHNLWIPVSVDTLDDFLKQEVDGIKPNQAIRCSSRRSNRSRVEPLGPDEVGPHAPCASALVFAFAG